MNEQDQGTTQRHAPNATRLIVPVAAQSIEQLREAIARVEQTGADLVELRLDMMPEIPDEHIHGLFENRAADIPILLTLRSENEGGDGSGPDAERLERLMAFAKTADFIDIEAASYAADAAVKAAVAQETPSNESPRYVLSAHDFTGRPRTLQKQLLEILEAGPLVIPKLAWQARTIRDNFEAFELMRLSPRPAIVICMGEDGLLSRVLARKFGAFAAFASLGPGFESAPGQPAIQTLRNDYRWNAINKATHVYGVIGDPIEHSISPSVHNAAFAHAGLNAVYLPMRITPSYEAFKAFMVEVDARPWLDFRGFSVTMPHKENALRFLRESGGEISSPATQIGAVNTLIRQPDNTWLGDNTDMPAALETLQAAAGDDLKGRTAHVLGAGGVARAIVAALTQAGAKVRIFNRTASRAAELAEAFDCQHADWNERGKERADILVNCTNIGQTPEPNAAPLPTDAPRAETVFDAIYNPPETKLLQQAEAAGAQTANGLEMFARQAVMQFELWTGQKSDLAFYREACRKAIPDTQ